MDFLQQPNLLSVLGLKRLHIKYNGVNPEGKQEIF